MNLHYGTIVDLAPKEGLLSARVRVGRALTRVSLALLAEAAPGDRVLVCDGVAIAKVETETKETHVPGHSR